MKYDPATCHPFDEECPKCGNVIQEAGAPVCSECDPELQAQRAAQPDDGWDEHVANDLANDGWSL